MNDSNNLTNHISKAITFITKGTQNEKCHNYENAVSNYKIAIECLNNALQYTQNQSILQALDRRIITYSNRISALTYISKTTSNHKHNPTEYYHYINITKFDQKSDLFKQRLNAVDQRSIHLVDGFCDHYIPSEIIQFIILYYFVSYIHPFSTYFGDIQFNDAIGLEHIIQSIIDSISNSNDNILLYGFPGTGKTFLSKAIYNNVNKIKNRQYDFLTFFINANNLCSSRSPCDALCEQYNFSRIKTPSIFFIDDLEEIATKNNIMLLKGEFIIELIGNIGIKCITIGITKQPWNLSAEILNFFQQQIFVPLPNKTARRNILKQRIGSVVNELKEEDWDILADKTEGFTGSDISALVQDAMMEPIRALQHATHFKKVKDLNNKESFMWRVCDSGDDNAVKITWLEICDNMESVPIDLEHVNLSHFENCLKTLQPSVSNEDVQMYKKWQQYSDV
eukprot:279428_1